MKEEEKRRKEIIEGFAPIRMKVMAGMPVEERIIAELLVYGVIISIAIFLFIKVFACFSKCLEK